MIDEFSQKLILDSQIPSQLSSMEIRDMISRSYLSWLAQNIFDVEKSDVSSFKDELRRISLASSILHSENIDSSDIDATAFLIAESAEVSSMFRRSEQQEVPSNTLFRLFIRYLDYASYYHLADYDANANVTAKIAFNLLDSENFNADGLIDVARDSYYRCLGYFLRGKFGKCQDEANKKTESPTTEGRGYLFLRTCLANLANKYRGHGDETIDKRLNNFQLALQNKSVSYFSLQAETFKVMAFYAAAPRKSLHQMLESEFSDQQEYLNTRISAHNNQGYPFAWPPTRSFCQKYFNEKKHHAVITVPTGGGKSFLAELASVDALRRGWVLYMAPTNALCSQIKADLKNNLASVSNIDIEAYLGELEYSEELPKFQMPRQVLVVTPEKALLLLKRQPEIFQECSAAILDECHLLASKNRGDIAEVVLAFCLSQNTDVRVILMSALVQDSANLASWLASKTGQQVANIDLNWRPTRIARLTVLPDWSTLEKKQKGKKELFSIGVRAFGDTVTPWKEDTPVRSWLSPIRLEHKDQQFPWINNVTRHLAARFVEKKIPTLVFVLKNRHHAFSIAEKLNFEFTMQERPQASSKEKNLIELANYELGTTTLLAQLIDEKWASVHTSTMLDCERKLSEISFERGRSLLLVATGTLSQGLNLVAKAVIVCGTTLSEYGNGLDNDPVELRTRSLTQVLNAMGRAARANIACRGTSIIVPDILPNNINQNISKQDVLQIVPSLRNKDASLEINSPIRDKLLSTSTNSTDTAPSRIERSLLALLPIGSEHLGTTINFTLGNFEIVNSEATHAIIRRLESIKTNAITSGSKEWILKAASFAGVEYELADNLYAFIYSCVSDTDFYPPDDSYNGWAFFLFDWLQQLPAYVTWDLLKLHIKAWHYYWGKDKDPNLVQLFEKIGYPEKETDESKEFIEQLWGNMRLTVQAWLDGETYLRMGELLTRRECSSDKENKRTSPGYHLPRAIMWKQGFIERLAQFAGLLLAIQNQWVENEPDSAPYWLSSTSTLHTLPIGLRDGVQNPFAAAWFRHVIQERRAANLLQKLAPLQSEAMSDIQEAWTDVQQSLVKFLQIDDERKIVNALKQLLSTL
ncbi:MAG: DEAD/DEAH box helicase [Anaerolineae bacterium]|jgi:hypothetical protein|nr:DEAD/DEAH box helicase [Anaerolineae bacterium]MBT7190129.1 DEAD/DEAH box helicase [Anaerolineae bacterium]